LASQACTPRGRRRTRPPASLVVGPLVWFRATARCIRCRRWGTNSTRFAIPCRNAGIAVGEVHPETLRWKPALRSRGRAARTPIRAPASGPIRAPASGPIPQVWPSPGPNCVVPLSRLERYPSAHRLKLRSTGYESVCRGREPGRQKPGPSCHWGSVFWRVTYSPSSFSTRLLTPLVLRYTLRRTTRLP
jgi:hypothetical protein